MGGLLPMTGCMNTLAKMRADPVYSKVQDWEWVAIGLLLTHFGPRVCRAYTSLCEYGTFDMCSMESDADPAFFHPADLQQRVLEFLSLKRVWDRNTSSCLPVGCAASRLRATKAILKYADAHLGSDKIQQ